MAIIEKLSDIKREKKLPSIEDGSASNAQEFFKIMIKRQFEDNKDTIKAIHKALMNYLERAFALYPIRLYGSFKDYNKLRRGFLSEYKDGNRTFFCDNTFAIPFAALKLSGLNYDSDELYKFLTNPQLNCGFSSTKQERELAFYNGGRDYKINLNGKGWYLAHIIPVGMGYKKDLKEIFPLPERKEWEGVKDRIRRVDNPLNDDELKTLKSHFIRLIHPLNSFIIPNTKHVKYKGKNLGEEPKLLAIVANYLEENFQPEYGEFMKVAAWPPANKKNASKRGQIGQINWTNKSLNNSSKSSISKLYKGDLEGQEIERVERRVPGWMSHPNQINSIILGLFLKLSNNNETPISLKKLEQEFKKENPELASKFKTNYYNMKRITPNNHAKVFDENNGEIKLWEPVKDFIIDLYK